MTQISSTENPYEVDNGIDIIPIEGAPYDLVITYHDATDMWHWQLRDLDTAETLLSNERRQWGEAMQDGIEAAVDMLSFEDAGFEDETAAIVDPTWQDWLDHMDTRNERSVQ